MDNIIYADNAATTKLDTDAYLAMKPYMEDEYANVSQPYSFARVSKKAIKIAREDIAKCIGAFPEEIYFTSGGTESNNWAIIGQALNNYDKKATITSSIEHHSVLNSCKTIEKLGYPVAYLSVNKNGEISADNLSSVITKKTGLVSIMMANNEIGTIQPVKNFAKIAHCNGSYFHTDAVQAVGHIPINVHELDVDMLSASSHKFNGPKGIGFLYIKKDTKIASYMNGGGQELGLRAGTENTSSIVGMSVALKNNCSKLLDNIKHIKMLEDRLLNGIKNIKYVKNGGKNSLPGLISLSFEGKYGEQILHRMDLMKIMVSTGSACDSVNTQISHVLKAIGLDENVAKGTIRISLNKDNTELDVDYIVKALFKIVT